MNVCQSELHRPRSDGILKGVRAAAGATALMVSAGCGRLAETVALLNCGANPRATATDGSTAADWARQFRRGEVLHLLEEQDEVSIPRTLPILRVCDSNPWSGVTATAIQECLRETPRLFKPVVGVHGAVESVRPAAPGVPQALARADQAGRAAEMLTEYHAATGMDIDNGLIVALLEHICCETSNPSPSGAVLIFLPGELPTPTGSWHTPRDVQWRVLLCSLKSVGRHADNEVSPEDSAQ